jgi:hypothetical protein
MSNLLSEFAAFADELQDLQMALLSLKIEFIAERILR